MLLFAVLYAEIFLPCHLFLSDGVTFFLIVYSMCCSFISVLCVYNVSLSITVMGLEPAIEIKLS